MGQRIAFGALAILVLVAIFEVDAGIARRVAEDSSGAGSQLDSLLERGSVLPLFFLGVAFLGVREFRRLLATKGAKPCMGFVYLMIAALILTPWLSAAGWLGSGPAEVEGLFWQIVWLVVTGVGTALLVVLRRDPEGALRDAGATAGLIFYLGFLTSFGLQMRCGRDLPGVQGVWLLLFVLLVIKASDIGSYFAGSVLGRHKLARLISPGKTVEGALGGVVASAVVAVAFAHLPWIGSALGLKSASFSGLAPFLGNQGSSFGASLVWRGALFGATMSIVGQFGDLIESCFKRDAKIKDSGRILPRFGGILDLIDSPVLAMPVAWLLLRVVWRSI